ncbi:MAG: response regulator [Elusimicrobiota bacterium]
MNKTRVLAVDDDQTVLDIIKQGLETLDYEVDTAESEADVWISLHRTRPDIILMDVSMPGLDGISLCKNIRTSPGMSDIPIIMLTAFSDEKTFHDAMLFGATDFLMKPFEISEVQKKIEDCLSKTSSQKGTGK